MKSANVNIEQAVQQLMLAQAQLTTAQARLSHAQTALVELAAADESFQRIRGLLDEIKALLVRREQMIADLPEAICQKLGFRGIPDMIG